MAMVVNNWQDHNPHQSPNDVTGLPPTHIPTNSVETVQSPPHHPNLSQTQMPGVAASSGNIIGQTAQNLSPESALTPLPQSRSPITTSRNGSVSDGSSLTTLGECPIQAHSTSSPSSAMEKPHIDCVVSCNVTLFA